MTFSAGLVLGMAAMHTHGKTCGRSELVFLVTTSAVVGACVGLAAQSLFMPAMFVGFISGMLGVAHNNGLYLFKSPVATKATTWAPSWAERVRAANNVMQAQGEQRLTEDSPAWTEYCRQNRL